MKEQNYWGYRIDVNAAEYFYDELLSGRLRQGWGTDEGQNLRNMTLDGGAIRNIPIMQRVKKGDILLIPRIPNWDTVVIAEATEDWDQGYKFAIDPKWGDYGHIFPAKFLRFFVRNSPIVKSNIRTTLHSQSRFWSVNHCANEINEILFAKDEEIHINQSHEDRMKTALRESFQHCFDEIQFSSEIYERMNQQFEAAQWEYALIYGLKLLFPFYEIEHTGGREEENHGTDILVKLPDLFLESRYAIAIQVKDYDGFVGEQVIDQINMADDYWQEKNLILIDKIVIITRAEQEQNLHLPENKSGVKFYFASELEKLLLAIGKKFIKSEDE